MVVFDAGSKAENKPDHQAFVNEWGLNNIQNTLMKLMRPDGKTLTLSQAVGIRLPTKLKTM